VRALAGVIFQFGLLPAGSYNLVRYVLRLSKAIKHQDESKSAAGAKYWDITRGFRATFARTAPKTASKVEYVRVHFLGVWDTVSSVGWVWDPTHFPYTAYNPCVEIVRHAVAIDERRWFFRQNLWDKPRAPATQDVREYWFPGVHCDVGGGYAEKSSGLWRTAFVWMLLEAKKAGLKIATGKVRYVLKKTKIRFPAWANEKHESLTWYWWPAEFFPKIPKWRGAEFQWPRLGLFRGRTIRDGELLHRSALRRIRFSEIGYSPRNVSPAFQRVVRDLPKVPETLAYRA
jgi:hypothetical protein